MPEEAFVDSVGVVYVATYLYIYIIIEIKKGKKYGDTMGGNTSLTVTQKARAPQYQILIQ